MKRSSSEAKAKPSAKLVGAMSSSIADDRTDAAVKLVSEFIIEDKVERSVLWCSIYGTCTRVLY